MIRPFEDPTTELERDVRDRIARHERVRLPLPHDGRLFVDRELPFLAVHRAPPDRPDPGTSSLVTGQAAYLVASGDPGAHREVSSLVDLLVSTLAPMFGGFLVLELWSAPLAERETSALPRPAFTIHAPQGLEGTVERLAKALREVSLLAGPAEVTVATGTTPSPPGLDPLLKAGRARRLGCRFLGVEVAPIHQDPVSHEAWPIVTRLLRQQLTAALVRGFSGFVREHTTVELPHHQALGRRSAGTSVWEVDRQLAELAEAFDFTLQVTPINVDAAWEAFQAARFERPPEFLYRPLPIDPLLHKRRLFGVPVERIEDPTLAHLFTEKIVELDRLLTMLQDRGGKNFLWSGLQAFGPVDDDLLALARRILRVVPARGREQGERIDARAFAGIARAEIAKYQEQWPELVAGVQIREDYTGLMHSSGHILVGANTTLAEGRVDALVQHEVGTHLVCYHNGRDQPFQQLYAGLRGYRELQEGLAVLAEYLVGGLDHPRMRMLAGRVVAAHAMVEGASFVDTFRELRTHHGFEPTTAWRIAMRVYRGGGLVRDAVYLRSLRNLLRWLGEGHAIEPLFVGRIGLEHVPFVRELTWREVLKPPRLRPLYLDRPDARERLERLRREGATPLDLVFDRSRFDAPGDPHERRA